MEKGDSANFYRNQLVNGENIKIIDVFEDDINKVFIIEHESGWYPDFLRKSLYGLDESKKYLFVSESELTLIETDSDE